MNKFKKVTSEIDLLTANVNFKNKIVIDAGCGTGKLTRLLAKQCAYIYGVDIPDLIKKAEETEYDSNTQFKVGVGQSLPFENNFADVIIFFASFHHIPAEEMERAIKECCRVLKSNGLVCFVEPVPMENSYYEISRLVNDEAEIQKHAYEIIKSLDSQNFSNLLEQQCYLERTYKDFENQLNIYVPEELRRADILKKAKAILTAKNVNIEEIIIKSYCRLNLLKRKAPNVL